MATFTNQATLTYNGRTTLSNIAVGELLEVLSITKQAVSGTYRIGDRITYVISLVNTGATTLTDLVVTDDLGATTFGTTTVYPLTYVDGSLLYYVNGVLQAAPAVTTTEPLTVTGITVPAGGNTALVYEATVTTAASPADGGTITNTATADGSVATPVSDTETITAATASELTIAKAISPTVVSENDRVTYTFTIQNFGNEPVVATDNAVVTDLFDPILTDLVVTLDGTVLTTPTGYTYNEATGLFQTAVGQITVPAATFTQDPTTGVWTTTPGTVVLTVVGTI